MTMRRTERDCVQVAATSIEVGPARARKRLAIAKAAVDRMPCHDLRFTELPTEEDDLVAALGGEIDEALVNILEEATQGFDPTGDFGHPGGERAQFRVAFDYLRQTHRIDSLIGADEFLDALAQGAGLELQVTNQHFKSWNKLVGVVGAEEFLEGMPRQFRLTGIARAARRDYV
jgi:hypothetical protein